MTLGERRLTHLPPQARRIGMLFQDDLLFDHLTVAENLMFGMPASLKGTGRGGKRQWPRWHR